MFTIEDFRGCLQEICGTKGFKEVIEVVTDEGKAEPGQYENRFRVKIYTDNNCYSIKAVEREKGTRLRQSSYLGCVASSRKPRAGETWTRGNDLPDGELTRATWEEIKNRIIAYELVKIAKPARRIPDERS